MAEQRYEKLNRLARLLPEGLLAEAGWLEERGYSSSLRSQYVAAGWLKQPARQVYERGDGRLSWQQVVVSLQGLMGWDVWVGGRTALELQGELHYVPRGMRVVHLYGAGRGPVWLEKLETGVRFEFHSGVRLFGRRLTLPREGGGGGGEDSVAQEWGHRGWRMFLSTPERAVLEMLDELPGRESFEVVDRVFEGLTGLRPGVVERLLRECRSVKTKRLFCYFAERSGHGWWKHVRREGIDLGSGKRMLVKGGRFEAKYGLTLPEELYAVG